MLCISLCSVQAPCEAEAQCAALVKAGKVYAIGTEDMDALTFGSSVLLRHLTFSEARSVFSYLSPLDKILYFAMFVCLLLLLFVHFTHFM